MARRRSPLKKTSAPANFRKKSEEERDPSGAKKSAEDSEISIALTGDLARNSSGLEE